MPNTPHLVPIPFPLTEGKEIIVEGQVHADAKRVTVSLVDGHDCKNNVAVTFDGRFPDVFVRNHHTNNQWGTEERQGRFPYKKGENVEIKIVVKNGLFQFFVNKENFCDFKPRIGIETAKNVYIEGDFTINKVSFSGSDSAQHAHGGGQYPEGHSLQDPPVPLNIAIAPLRPGRKLVICGVPTGKDRFSVNLSCGPSFDADDIAVHIDIRFHYGNSVRKAVINTRIGGKWGGEDVEHSGFPFIANEVFEMIIKVKESAFKISVDGEKFDQYHFRFGIERITHLSVVGAVKLNYVKL